MQYNMSKNALGGGSKFGTDGGALTTELYLANDPTVSLEAATKRYVDGKITTIQASSIVSGTMPIARFPGYSGDIVNTAGSNVLSLKNSGVTPGTYPKVTVTPKGIVTEGASLSADDIPNLTWSKVSIDRPTTLSGFGISNALSKSGGVVTGFISVMNAPTQTLHAANKSYVDNFSISGGSGTATGTIHRLPQTTTPTGYLRCNGSLVSKTAYPDLYSVIGDNTASFSSLPGSGQPWSGQYLFNETQSADIVGWTLENQLPAATAATQCVVTKNRVYLIGGRLTGGNFLGSYTAPINADGTLGSWVTGPGTPVSMTDVRAFVLSGRVYLLGHLDGNSQATTACYYTTIDPSGTLGAWSPWNPLASAVASPCIFSTGKRIYSVGGKSDLVSPSNVVQSAPIQPNGTIGTWVNGVNLPSVRLGASCVVTKDRVYLIGGTGSDLIPKTTIYTAVINSDGTIGTWASVGVIPGPRSYCAVFVTKNRLYLIGGFDGSSTVSSVYTASINTDGTLGAWTTGTSLPIMLNGAKVFVTSSRIYYLGGYMIDQALSASVYSASVVGGLNDYSGFYTGGYSTTDPDNFRLPDYTSLESSDFKYYIKY